MENNIILFSSAWSKITLRRRPCKLGSKTVLSKRSKKIVQLGLVGTRNVASCAWGPRGNRNWASLRHQKMHLSPNPLSLNLLLQRCCCRISYREFNRMVARHQPRLSSSSSSSNCCSRLINSHSTLSSTARHSQQCHRIGHHHLAFLLPLLSGARRAGIHQVMVQPYHLGFLLTQAQRGARQWECLHLEYLHLGCHFPECLHLGRWLEVVAAGLNLSAGVQGILCTVVQT